VTKSDDKPRGSFFSRLKAGLSRTRELLSMNVGAIARGIGPVDESVLAELEDALILADVGVPLATEYTEALRAKWRKGELPDIEALRASLRKMVEDTLAPCAVPIRVRKPGPFVILVVGVNGAGKTTTIGKIAAYFKEEGHSVLLAAGDTFRAAAIGQLKIWADRAQAEFVQHREGSDSSAVAFDAVRAGRSRNIDVVIIDTAGRLHTKTNLMDEMKKVVRVIGKEIPDAPHEVLLVLDATSGQNAIAQAKIFGEATGVTGIALTKLDGTAKGGVVLAVTREIGVPIRFIGVGEGIEDLRPFDARGFAEALFQPGS
jgi:fused signal recognition particle receptor